jgi:hypothetical protein
LTPLGRLPVSTTLWVLVFRSDQTHFTFEFFLIFRSVGAK